MTTELDTGNESLQDKKQLLINDLKGVVGAARSKIQTELGEARAAVTDGAKCAAGATCAYAKENPWKVLGMAAAAGMLFGLLFSRR